MPVTVLSCYIAGLSTSAIEYISKALDSTFGVCSVEDIGRDTLRYKVRTASRDSSVVLVVLDTASMEECRDIENGLYSSDKFYNYVSTKDLVSHLNKLYGLNMMYIDEDIPTPLADVFSDVVDDREELREMYLSQLSDRDSIISNLGCRIRELETQIKEGGYSSKDIQATSNLEEEILKLKGIITDKENRIDFLNSTISSKKKSLSDSEDTITKLRSKIKVLEGEKTSLAKELSEERVTSSKKSAVINDAKREEEKLQSRISELTAQVNSMGIYKKQNEELDTLVKELRNTISNLEIDISTKDSEIGRISIIADSKVESDAKVSELKRILSECEAEINKQKKLLGDAEGKYSDLLEKYSELSDLLSNEKERYSELETKYAESEKYLAEANETCLELKEQIRVLSSVTQKDAGVEAIMRELSELRRKYAELHSNIFSSISSKSLPKSSVKVPLFYSTATYENIRFVFSGSSESRKGTYKCLYKELGASKDRYLIVDVTSETAIDYVFKMQNVVDGLDWYSSGGSVQRHLSQTCLSNVKVLSPKIGYVNDGFFLTINWEKRLSELNNSGYKVIIYCGDISNLVGRVLFEFFTDIAEVDVYVHGNVLGSRAMIANAGGLRGIKACRVRYYDYDKNIAKFYELMSKRCQCDIVSKIVSGT